MIFVRVEMPAVFQDEDGSIATLQPLGPSVYEPVSNSLYRLNRWQGLFRRFLVRAKGFGREFWIDENARRMAVVEAESRGVAAAVPRWKPVATAKGVKRGCGCGAKKG